MRRTTAPFEPFCYLLAFVLLYNEASARKATTACDCPPPRLEPWPANRGVKHSAPRGHGSASSAPPPNITTADQRDRACAHRSAICCNLPCSVVAYAWATSATPTKPLPPRAKAKAAIHDSGIPYCTTRGAPGPGEARRGRSRLSSAAGRSHFTPARRRDSHTAPQAATWPADGDSRGRRKSRSSAPSRGASALPAMPAMPRRHAARRSPSCPRLAPSWPSSAWCPGCGPGARAWPAVARANTIHHTMTSVAMLLSPRECCALRQAAPRGPRPHCRPAQNDRGDLTTAPTKEATRMEKRGGRHNYFRVIDGPPPTRLGHWLAGSSLASLLPSDESARPAGTATTDGPYGPGPRVATSRAGSGAASGRACVHTTGPRPSRMGRARTGLPRSGYRSDRGRDRRLHAPPPRSAQSSSRRATTAKASTSRDARGFRAYCSPRTRAVGRARAAGQGKGTRA